MLETQKREKTMGQLIRIAILSWSAALLTASYAGLLAKMDPTFIATVFTASAATFGINTMKKDGPEDARRDSQPPLTTVEPTPDPEPPTIATEPVAGTEAGEGCPACGSGDTSTDTSVPVGRV
jgi:type IV secretory pathway VirB10-like protein